MVFGIHHGPVEGKTVVAPKCIDGRVSLKGHIHEQVVRRKGQTGRLGAKRIASDNGKVLAGAEIEKSTMETKWAIPNGSWNNRSCRLKDVPVASMMSQSLPPSSQKYKTYNRFKRHVSQDWHISNASSYWTNKNLPRHRQSHEPFDRVGGWIDQRGL